MPQTPLRTVIDRLGHRGDGVGADALGAPLYVPRALPGEVVEGVPEGDRIPAPRIATPSTDRVSPPCPHFRRCGGCALQHAPDGFVAAWKVDRVRAALRAAGLDPPVALAHTSPPSTRRRAVLTGRRTKKGALVGFHAAGTHDVVAIPDCRLLHPALMAALPALEEATRRLAPRGGTLGLHVTATEAGVDVAATGAKPVGVNDLLTLAPAFARLTVDGEPVFQSAPPILTLGPARIVPPPGAFLQATAEGEAALLAAVCEITSGAKRIADLFAGLGTFALPLSTTARVTAYEGDAALVDVLGKARAPGVQPVAAHRRDLYRDPLTAGELRGFDAVVIDPPRAGAAAQAAHLARADVAAIAFVSCDPVTFARDAGMLAAGGWTLGPVAVVDQFRWSPHVETVAAFTR